LLTFALEYVTDCNFIHDVSQSAMQPILIAIIDPSIASYYVGTKLHQTFMLQNILAKHALNSILLLHDLLINIIVAVVDTRC